MKQLIYYIFIALMMLGNVLAAWKFFAQKESLLQQFPQLDSGFSWFRWLPVANLLALAGMFFWRKWAVWLVLSLAALTITADIIYGIDYHLYVSVISTMLLCALIFLFWKNFK